MNIDEAVVRVHRVGEHAAEFHFRNALLDVLNIGSRAVQTLFVVFCLSHFKQLACIVEVLLDFYQTEHYTFQHLAFAAQILSTFGILPDGGIFGKFTYFSQAFLLGIEVKDTSVILHYEEPSPAIDWRGR